MKKMFSNINYVINLVWKKSHTYIFLKIFSVILSCVRLYINSIYLKVIIDSISNRSIDNTFITLTIIQFVSLIMSILNNILINRIMERLEYKIRNDLSIDFVNKTSNLDLRCYEDFSFYDSYSKALRIADYKAINILNLIVSLIDSVISILLLASMIAYLDLILIVFMIALMISNVIDTFLSNEASMKLYEAQETINRQLEYLKRVAHHRQYAKELRVYSMFPFIKAKISSSFLEKFAMFKKTNKNYWNIKLVFSLINNLILTLSILFYLVYQTYNGKFSIGEFTMLFTVVFSCSSYAADIFNVFSNISFENKYYLNNLRRIIDYEPVVETKGGKPINKDELHDIEFKNVYFKYENCDEYVIKNLSFKINKGEKIAIVGKNGSGKSTIIKLVLRLYDVDNGEILIDGLNIKEYDVVQLRNCFSTLLQDFNKYSFSINENISLSMTFNQELVNNSLKKVKMYEKVQSLKQKGDTYITKEFNENGVDLSGGEYQKICLARVFNHNSSFLLLDEVNSALDPYADVELVKQLMSSNYDKSILMISHRICSIAIFDRIIVLDSGRIVEQGSHEELINNKNLYYDIYSKQMALFEIQNEIQNYT